MEQNRQKFEKSSDALQTAWQQLQDNGPLEDAWSTVSPETDLLRRESLTERDPNENNDALPSEQIPELQDQRNERLPRALISVEWLGDSMKPLLQSMNQKQKEIFYFVRNWCLQKSQNENPEPFCLHVTGGAGTGKSHLIKCIYYEASKLLKNQNNPEEVKVLLTAPTGTAAFNIGAFTVHSALKIPRAAGYTYQPLGNDALNTLQSQLAGLQILIVDEISMVDLKVLAHVHGRLKQVKQIRTTDRRSLFGGVCILAVGDFYQLPPVKAQPVCLPNVQLGSDMWNDNFEIVTLEEIMRQKDDVAFANTLNALRTKRKSDPLQESDENALKSCVDRTNIPQDALHVFARNKDVDLHNNTLLHKNCTDIKIVEAQDYGKDGHTGKSKLLLNARKALSDDLTDHLTIATGARVMLLRNIDVTDGLVNGAFGTVVEIQTDNQGIAKAIHIKFDSEKVGKKRKLPNHAVPIERNEDKLSGVNATITRRQFPLKLAWACTIHKVQGMTVNQIVYDMIGTFSNGQAYVAMSRATSLQGLYLKNFDPKLIYRADKVHTALQQMKPFKNSTQDADVEDNERQNTTPSLTIVHHNVHGLRSKLGDIKANKDLVDIDILAVTETWLSEDVTDQQISLEGFNVYRRDRGDARGGVCLYVSKRFNIERLQFQTFVEFCAVKIHATDLQPFIVCVIYRPPKIPVHRWLPHMKDLIDQMKPMQTGNFVVTGDFNEDQSKQPLPIATSFLEQHDMSNYVDQPTTKYGSILDLMFVTSLEYNNKITVVPTYYSDHDCVKLDLTYDETRNMDVDEILRHYGIA